MVDIQEILNYCDTRTRRTEIKDFSGALNGLQFQNNGKVTKIGAAVDAGYLPCKQAIERNIDFLVVHHGLFWGASSPVTGPLYSKYHLLMEGNLAIYGSHLPLDCHPEIGNNASIAKKLHLEPIEWFLEYEENNIGLIAQGPSSREILSEKLQELFPETFTKIEYGSQSPQRIGICSGSGDQAIGELKKHKIDTLITGELRQHQFNQAQELELNLYPCGHYYTEVFGVQNLAKEIAEEFNLEWEFIPTNCPL